MIQPSSTTIDSSIAPNIALEHIYTGIKGLDEILNGGLPKGRATLVCGGPGCGKTLLGMEFLVNGARLYGERGVFMSFEESAEELEQNFTSLRIDLAQLEAEGKISIDYVYFERNEIEETGEYDLEGLFVRLGTAIDSIGAKRVVLDTIESLFSGFSNTAILRSELRRLFRWLKSKGVTAIITGERGEGQLTRQGLEEYVSDCVILMDQRVEERITSRYLRVVKYRGSTHGNDEYPFLISDQGISVLPITSVGLNYTVSDEFLSSGVPRLDEMLGGKGYYRGSSILVSGTSGSGKTSLSAKFAIEACRRGEKCLYFAFEEPATQIIRNMCSIGIDLQTCVDQGLVRFHAVRPSMYGLERHLLIMQDLVDELKPDVVIVDPITNLITSASQAEVKSMIVRLIDYLKMNHITALFTSLTSGEATEASTEVGVSSLMDTWLLVRYLESNGERNRGIYVLKSRGMNHSNQIREFRMTDHGIELVDVYLGRDGILTGTARASFEAQTRMQAENREIELERKKRELVRRQQEIAGQIAALQATVADTQEELTSLEHLEQMRLEMDRSYEAEIAKARGIDPTTDQDHFKNE